MELTVAQKLDTLLILQSIDSQLDEIIRLRGDLPDEVRDLEDEVVGFETRIGKFKKEIETLDAEVNGYRLNKKDAEKLIQKYKDQQMNVRNNREYEAISKELELQELEIQLAEKRSREAEFKIKNKSDEIAKTQETLDNRKKDLELKRKELDVLISESQEDEKKLLTSREKAASNVEERLLNAYNRIRNNSGNGLAIVMVKRGACGGCFNLVPPQRQADIKEKKKIIVCEHCGRLLADVDVIEVGGKR
jgi:predicted  nucleic acid-binding Zn-ribbon protein